MIPLLSAITRARSSPNSPTSPCFRASLPPLVVGSPRPGTTLRCALGPRTSLSLALVVALALCGPYVRSAPRAGVGRPPCGRPLRVRRPVCGVASAPGFCLWSGTGGKSKSTAPPAGPAQGSWGVRCRAAVGLLGGWVRSVVPLAWPRRQPDFRRGRNRRRGPWVVNCVLAGCAPAGSPVGLRLPGEGNNRPRGEYLRCARPAGVKSCAASRPPSMQATPTRTTNDPHP
jgi:hypothetical protein